MKKRHRIFIAIPFDAATRNQYNRIGDEITNRYPTVTWVIGNKEVGPSPQYSDIASFKAQNRELTKQFVHQITEADIVIADLTHNNPNVHVELGIALTQNKNILRVSGRSITELGFDIRNLEIYTYKNEHELLEKITTYLDIFFKIKQLPISKECGELYCEEPDVPIELRAREEETCRLHSISNCQGLMVRDGAVQVEFEILAARKPRDWFGVYFRVGDSPFLGSHLAYVRQDGRIEIAVYPGPRVIARESYGDRVVGKHLLRIEFENNEAEVRFENVKLVTDKLSHQTAGHVLPAAYCSDVDLHSAQMICRDTIEWDLP